MKTRIVKRHYCEFCGKGMFQIPAMKRHESSCTMNPNRVCKMCQLDEYIIQPPMSELIEAARIMDPQHKYDSSTCNSDVLREAANNCPACILAALRQTGNYMEFDFKHESRDWLDEHRQDRWEGVAR